MSETRRKERPRIRHLVLFVAVLLGLFEVLAMIGVEALARDLRLGGPERYRASEEAIGEARASYDPDLGWVVAYDTPFGERPRRHDYGRALAAVFGDSFAHGDDVGHAETWAEQLAALATADVFNYGSSAYGMDQALLRLERDFEKTPAEWAILGFITYDIERNVTVYWKFMYPESDMALVKPRFFLAGEGLELWPNPIRSADDLVLLRDPGFLRELAAGDGWYNLHGLPEPGFPHLATLFRPRFLAAAWTARQPRDLWAEGEAREITERILMRFDAAGRARGAESLLVHLPVAWEVSAFLESGRLPAAMEAFEKICHVRGLTCFTPLRGMAGLGHDVASRFFLDGGHYSPEGHRFIAEQLASLLERRAGVTD